MKLLSGILSKTSNNNKEQQSTTTSSSSSTPSSSVVSSSLNSNNSIGTSTVSYVSGSVSSVGSLSSTTISKTRKEQLQLNCSASTEVCNTSGSIQSQPPLSSSSSSSRKKNKIHKSSSKKTLSPTPAQSCSFSSPKKTSNFVNNNSNNNSSSSSNIHKEQTISNQYNSPNTTTLVDTTNELSKHKRQLSEDFLNSLSFALPQIEYEQAMKQVQQRTANQNDNITAENIEVQSSDCYDFEYYNKEEEEKRLKKKGASSKSNKKTVVESKLVPSQHPIMSTHTPSTPSSSTNNTSFKSPINNSSTSAQQRTFQTPIKSNSSTSSSSAKSKPVTPAVNQSTEALTTLSSSKSRLSLKPSSIRKKLKKKDTPKLQPTPTSVITANNSGPVINNAPTTVFSEPVLLNGKERKKSEKKNSTKSSNTMASSNLVKIPITNNDDEEDEIGVMMVAEDEDMQDRSICSSSATTHHNTATEMEDDEDGYSSNNEEEYGEEEADDSCNTMTSPRTPCSKKRKAFEEFDDSPGASSKKKKEDSIMLDSVIKKVMDISIPDTPAILEDSPTCSSSLSISPSLSYNSQSTCGEHSEYCSSLHDSISYDAKLYNAQPGVDFKEVNQKITTLTKVIEQRNDQILHRDEFIMSLSKENKELKKFKSMISKLDEVGVVFYMKASELVCEGLMVRDLNTKESQEIVHDSLQKGIRYMRASAEFGNVDAMFEYAELILRYSKSKKHEAKEFLQKASERGHKKAGVFLKSLEMKEESQRYEKSVEHDHLFLYGQETKSKRK